MYVYSTDLICCKCKYHPAMMWYTSACTETSVSAISEKVKPLIVVMPSIITPYNEVCLRPLHHFARKEDFGIFEITHGRHICNKYSYLTF
jgi:hypothetical protein